MRFASLLLLAYACASPATSGSTEWSEAFDASEAGWLLDVTGRSADDLLAVGGEPSAGALWRFDGARWAADEALPEVPLLNWAQVFADEVFVVGNEGTILRSTADGYERMSAPTSEHLWGVWGASADDLWAVGGSGFAGSAATILRFDGSTWRIEPTPELVRSGVRAFYKVWGRAADDVWIVGQGGAVLHWDGESFEELFVGATDDLISVWGTDDGRVVLVGGRGNAQCFVSDGFVAGGTGWRAIDLGFAPGLNGVWFRDDVIFAVGVEGYVAEIDFQEGSVRERYLETRDDLHAVFGVDGELFSVGGNFAQSSGPFRGTAWTRAR